MLLQRLVLLAFAPFAASQGVFQPNQCHLSFTGDGTSMGLDFVTDDRTNCTATGVAYGTSPASMPTFVPSASCFFLTGVGWQNQVRLTGLVAGTRYYYTAGSQVARDSAWSEVFSFVMPDVSPSAAPLSAAVYADFGWLNAESLPKLYAGALAGEFDFVIHAGDFA